MLKHAWFDDAREDDDADAGCFCRAADDKADTEMAA